MRLTHKVGIYIGLLWLATLPVIAACSSPAPAAPTAATRAAAPAPAATQPPASAPGATTASAVAASVPKTLLWGVTTSMTGPSAVYGKWISRGHEMAAEDVNKKGGVKIGDQVYNFAVKVYDHAFDANKNIEALTKLILEDKADFLYTHGAAATNAAMPLINQHKKIVFNSVGGNAVMTNPGAYYLFRMQGGDVEAPMLLYQYVAKAHPNVKTVVWVAPDDESGRADSQISAEQAAKVGIKHLEPQYFTANTTDFYPILTKVLAQKPDAINMGRSGPAYVAQIIKQARELGFKGLLLNTAIGDTASVIKGAGASNAEGWTFPSAAPYVGGGGRNTPEEDQFVATVKAKYGEDPNDAMMITNPGVWITAQAIQKAQTLDTDKLIDTLATSEFTVLGRKARFCGDNLYPNRRQIDMGLAIVTIQNGKTAVLGEPERIPDAICPLTKR